MNREFLLNDVEAWKRLAENLQRCEQISKHDQGKDREAWTLSHAFADLEQSFRRILEDKLPTLMNPGLEILTSPPQVRKSMAMSGGAEW